MTLCTTCSGAHSADVCPYRGQVAAYVEYLKQQEQQQQPEQQQQQKHPSQIVVSGDPSKPLIRQHISPEFKEWDIVCALLETCMDKYSSAIQKLATGSVGLPTCDERLSTTQAPSANPVGDVGVCVRRRGLLLTPTIRGNPSLLLFGFNKEDVRSHFFAKDVVATISKAMLMNRELVFLLGTSGAGKTRAALEFLTESFGLYISARVGVKGGPGAADLSAMVEKINGKKGAMLGTERKGNDELGQHTILACILSRLTLLLRVLSISTSFSPRFFMLAQILPHVILPANHNQPHTLDFFEEATTILRSASIDDLLAAVMDRLSDVLALTHQHNLPIVLDEVQLLLESGMGLYSSSTEPAGRPLYSPIVKAILKAGGTQVLMPVIVSGTGLSVTDAETMSGSSSAKGNASSVRVPVTINRSREQLMSFLGSFMHLRGHAEAVRDSWFSLCGLVRGRPRFAARLIELAIQHILFDNSELRLSKLTNSLVQELTWQGGHTSLWTSIDRVKTRGSPELWEHVMDATALYVYGGVPVVFPELEAKQLVECGFAQLETKDDALLARLDEPLIAMAVQHWCGRKELDLSHRIRILMGKLKHVPSGCGTLWETILPEDLGRLFDGQTPLNQHPLFQEFPNPPPHFFFPARILPPPPSSQHHGMLCRPAGSNYKLPQFLHRPSTAYFIPENLAGPDVVFFVEFLCDPPLTIACFLQAKLQLVVGKKQHAAATVVPEQFYSTNPSSRQAVLDVLKRDYNRDKGVIQFIVAYPAVTNLSDSSVERRRSPRSASTSPPDVTLVIEGDKLHHFLQPDHIEFLSSLKVDTLELKEIDEEEAWDGQVDELSDDDL